MSQRELAVSIVREGVDKGISTAYLNDIEHDRRNPTDESLIREFARVLSLDASYLLLIAAGQIPAEFQNEARAAGEEKYSHALSAFRDALRR